MRKLILAAFAALVLSSPVLAQAVTTTNQKGPAPKKDGEFSAQSESRSLTSTSLSLLRLDDGETKLAAFAVPNFTFKNTRKLLKLNTIGAYDPEDIGQKAYLGVALSLDIVDYQGFKATAYYGVRGYDFNKTALNFGEVVGFGITIPLEKLGGIIRVGR